jgi:hypothetical protein
VDYNPLKGMPVLISSLKLSTVPNAAGPESRGYSTTAWLYIENDLILNACVKMTEMFICGKILITFGNKIYLQTMH